MPTSLEEPKTVFIYFPPGSWAGGIGRVGLGIFKPYSPLGG